MRRLNFHSLFFPPFNPLPKVVTFSDELIDWLLFKLLTQIDDLSLSYSQAFGFLATFLYRMGDSLHGPVEQLGAPKH